MEDSWAQTMGQGLTLGAGWVGVGRREQWGKRQDNCNRTKLLKLNKEKKKKYDLKFTIISRSLDYASPAVKRNTGQSGKLFYKG